MRVPHYAMRPLAALALIGLVAGCGRDSTGPEEAPFDPAGTISDIGTIEATFQSDAMADFAGAAEAMGSALGGTPAAMALRAAPSGALVSGDRSGARRYAGNLAKAWAAGPRMRPAPSSSAILEEHLGVTFTRDPETLEYEPSDRPGAPSNGVRFIVYAVNPISGQPTSPLEEVGHADVEVTETTNSATIRIELVSDGVTYLDYAVGATGGETSATITVQGFVSNGKDRVNFDLDVHFGEAALGLDYSFHVPTRGNFRMDIEEEMKSDTLTSALELRGPHGSVTIEGTHSNSAGGSYEVEVNGDLVATITVPQGSEPVIAGADGEELTEQQLEALRTVFLMFLGGFDFFEDLLDPLSF